jgi:molybdopterin molybdotransferase
MGFLQIALPGLFRLSGSSTPPLRCCTVRIGKTLQTKFPDWTQFFYGKLEHSEGPEPPRFIPLIKKSRLRSMAEAEAIVAIPEGESVIEADHIIPAQLLD